MRPTHGGFVLGVRQRRGEGSRSIEIRAREGWIAVVSAVVSADLHAVVAAVNVNARRAVL
jgi:hypothetical protein